MQHENKILLNGLVCLGGLASVKIKRLFFRKGMRSEAVGLHPPSSKKVK